MLPAHPIGLPEAVLRDAILKARSPGFLEKSRTFAKSLLKDSNLVRFLRRSRLNDLDEENQPPIGYLFPVNNNIFYISSRQHILVDNQMLATFIKTRGGRSATR
jgi:hypothetical protein